MDELLYRIWECMSKFDMDNKLSLSRKRSRADESATLKGKRPDLCITTARALLFKGEDTSSEEHNTTVYDLRADCQCGAASLLLEVEYFMYYACAGSMLQFCALPRDGNVARTLGRQFSMAIEADRLCIIAVATQVYQVIKAQRGHLPDHYFPLGC